MAGGWKSIAEGCIPRYAVTAAEFSPALVPVRSTLVQANAEGRITSSDSFMEVRFPAGTLREDTIVLLSESPPPTHSKELELAGSLYKIDTGIVPLAGSYKIEAHPPSNFSGRRELLALYVHTGGYFRYIGGAEGKELFSGETQWATAFGLFEDSKPPTFGRGRVVRRGRETRIELRVRDGGAGLECDDIQVLANGRRLLHEYDSETTLISAILSNAPSPGASIQVRIDATDRVGNSSSSTQTLRTRK